MLTSQSERTGSIFRSIDVYDDDPKSGVCRVRVLEILVPTALLDLIHNLADILRTAPAADEEGVFGLDHEEVPHADQGDHLPGAVDQRIRGIDADELPADGVPLCVLRRYLPQGVPASQVGPAEAPGDDQYLFGLFHHAVVDRNRLEPRVDL